MILKYLGAAADQVFGTAPSASERLREAAVRAGAVDSDVARLLPSDLLKRADELSDGEMDVALASMRRTKPQLFTAWSEMSDSEFRSAESVLRSSLRPKKPEFEFAGIDSARLTSAELHEYEIALRGNANGYDRSVLAKAAARQRAEDAQTKA